MREDFARVLVDLQQVTLVGREPLLALVCSEDAFSHLENALQELARPLEFLALSETDSYALQ